jgi:glycerate kinase
MLNFEEALKTCDLVITGEGQMDFQTAYGKAPIGIAAMAKRYHLPVIAIVGSKGTACETVYAHGIDAVFSILDKPMTLETAMHDSAELVANCAENIMRTFKLAARE